MEIDFVVTWVDPSDSAWQAKKTFYTGTKASEGNTEVRYRDWDTLKYWFRGVKKFAPWVRHVYFVTDDQKPEWLNTDHPKLKWIKHTDFIPGEYLPVFTSHPIEWNLHRIDGISDHFVYFNDERSRADVTPWCIRDWQLLSGMFYPKRPIGRFFQMESLEGNDDAMDYLRRKKGKVICLNDTEDEKHFELHKQVILAEFERLLPEKSKFER